MALAARGSERSMSAQIATVGIEGPEVNEQTMTVHELMRLKQPELSAETLFEKSPDDFAERAARGAAVAALHADDVDCDGRFPGEAITAAKALGLLGLMAPRQLGG